jgi:hypothetical protein
MLLIVLLLRKFPDFKGKGWFSFSLPGLVWGAHKY